MSDIAIKLENISKQYRLGVVGTGTLSHDLNRWWARMRGKDDPSLKIGQENSLAKAGGEYVWALKDIDLEVKKGEILGIIGKNGAGKSTLLKLLSQVTGPTTGQIKVNGRIASLLEVGTGFHPELTGRENIFLNGAILGMTKTEIKSKLDEIIEFAGVAKYVDTPVKRYSSGMYVRLAFAVAAHLEPDILVVDEVLAVGDAEFQKKAIGKMQDVSRGGGRTVLFVSHNMASVQNLCSNAVVMENGKIIHRDITDNAIEFYLSNIKERNINKELSQRVDRQGSGVIRIESIYIKNKILNLVDRVRSGDDIEFIFEFRCVNKINNVKIAFGITDKYNRMLMRFSSDDLNLSFNNIQSTGFFSCKISQFPLAKGRYSIGFMVSSNNEISDYISGADAFGFTVEEGDFFKSGKNSNHAPVLVKHNWKLNN